MLRCPWMCLFLHTLCYCSRSCDAVSTVWMCLISFVWCVSCLSQLGLCMYLMCRSVNRGDQPLSLKSVCRAESGCGSGILLDFRETFFFFSSSFFFFLSFLQHALFCFLSTSFFSHTGLIWTSACVFLSTFMYKASWDYSFKKNQTEWHLQYFAVSFWFAKCEKGVRSQCNVNCVTYCRWAVALSCAL